MILNKDNFVKLWRTATDLYLTPEKINDNNFELLIKSSDIPKSIVLQKEADSMPDDVTFQVLKTDCLEISKQDPSLLKEPCLKNNTIMKCMVAELGFSRLYPSLKWLNKDREKNGDDFLTKNRKRIDVKFTENEDNNLVIKSFKDENKYADIYSLILVKNLEDSFSIRIFGYATKDMVLNRKADFSLNNSGLNHKIDKSVLLKEIKI